MKTERRHSTPSGKLDRVSESLGGSCYEREHSTHNKDDGIVSKRALPVHLESRSTGSLECRARATFEDVGRENVCVKYEHQTVRAVCMPPNSLVVAGCPTCCCPPPNPLSISAIREMIAAFPDNRRSGSACPDNDGRHEQESGRTTKCWARRAGLRCSRDPRTRTEYT